MYTTTKNITEGILSNSDSKIVPYMYSKCPIQPASLRNVLDTGSLNNLFSAWINFFVYQGSIFLFYLQLDIQRQN